MLKHYCSSVHTGLTLITYILNNLRIRTEEDHHVSIRYAYGRPDFRTLADSLDARDAPVKAEVKTGLAVNGLGSD
jgi:hypothetical protein